FALGGRHPAVVGRTADADTGLAGVGRGAEEAVVAVGAVGGGDHHAFSDGARVAAVVADRGVAGGRLDRRAGVGAGIGAASALGVAAAAALGPRARGDGISAAALAVGTERAIRRTSGDRRTHEKNAEPPQP